MQKDDLIQYQEFFDLSRDHSTLQSRPMYLHLDMSKLEIDRYWRQLGYVKKLKVEGK
jgi:hypothetical protein